MIEIPLTQGKVALVDDNDYDRVRFFNWWAFSSSKDNTYYAITSYNIRMHRLITGYELTDHIDGNGLNNQRENLRSCTSQQNSSNSRKTKITASKFKGLALHRPSGKWIARIRFNYKRINLGYFKDEVEAAKAYDEAARKYFGEFAALNFPNEGERGAL